MVWSTSEILPWSKSTMSKKKASVDARNSNAHQGEIQESTQTGTGEGGDECSTSLSENSSGPHVQFEGLLSSKISFCH